MKSFQAQIEREWILKQIKDNPTTSLRNLRENYNEKFPHKPISCETLRRLLKKSNITYQMSRIKHESLNTPNIYILKEAYIIRNFFPF